MNEIRIRPATECDAPALSEIYNYYVLHTTATFAEYPLNSDVMRRKLLEVHHDRLPFLVAETKDGVTAGYACADRFRSLDTNRLAELSIYFAPEYIGRGWGTPLILELISKLRSDSYYAGLMAVVTSDNEPSLRFHRRLGFLDAGIWKRAAYKQNKWCDVQVLRYPVIPEIQ